MRTRGVAGALFLAAGALVFVAAGSSASAPVEIPLAGTAPLTSLGAGGAHIFWTRSSRAAPPSLYTNRDGREAVIWTGRSVPAPAGPGETLVQNADSVAASRSAVALDYAAWIDRGAAGQQILFGEIWAGSPGGPLRQIGASGASCPHQRFAFSDDVSGRRIVFSDVELSCDQNAFGVSRVVAGSFRGGRFASRVVAGSSRLVYEQVATAGRYVAWEAVDPRKGRWTLSVHDLRVHRTVYTLGPAALNRSGTPTPFDLQADGTVAVLADRQARCPNGAQLVGWASPRQPRLHVVSRQAFRDQVHISNNRILFVRANPGCKDIHQRLVSSDLKGHQRVIARDRDQVRLTGDFDQAAKTFTYATLNIARPGFPQSVFVGRR
jgi:hypothetical protein